MKAIITSAIVSSLLIGLNLNALTLNDVVDDALTTNPVVLERLKNYDKTVYDLKIAESGYSPTLDLISKFGYKYSYDKYSNTATKDSGHHMYQNSLTLTQNLFNGYATKYQIKYEEARVMAAAYNYVEKTNDVAFNVVKEYLNVLKFKELLDLEKENVSLTQDILNKTKELADAGSGLLSDEKKVDSSLQLAEFNYLTQENNLLDAQFNLGKYVGKKVSHQDLEKPTFNYKLPSNIDEATKHSVEYNPSILVTNFNIQTAKAALVQAKSNFSPKLDFELAYNFDRNTSDTLGHNRNYTALLVFRHNLYKGNADVNNVKKNKLNIMQEYEIQREIKRQLIEGLQLSWSAYTMIEKQIVFLNSYKNESKTTLDLYRQEFEDGSRTLIDLLTAQDDFISSQSKLITATYDLLFAKFRVLDAMGEMVSTIFKNPTKYYKPINANYQQLLNYDAQENSDRDGDKVIDSVDLCDNTQLGLNVDMFGCAQEVVDMVPQTNNISIEKDNSDLNTLENPVDGFVLNLATFSSQEEVDKFLKSTNLENNSITIKYETKNTKRTLYKIISNVYETKNDAREALSKLPRIVKINSPYIDNFKNVKNTYKTSN